MAVGYEYCTGPVHIFAAPSVSELFVLAFPSPSSALYLGTCEQYPLVQGIQQWEPVYNDIAGARPFDKQYFGESKVLICDLNKMIQTNINEILRGDGVIGQEGPLARGLYKNQSGESFVVWLKFSYFGTAVAIPDLPPGEVYFNCNIAETGYDPIGTRNRKTRLIIEDDPAYAVNSSPIATAKGFGTYSIDPTYFVGLPAVA